MVVGRRDRVSLLVGELQFDVRVRETHLVKERGRDATKPMSRHPVLVPKALERFEDGVFDIGRS